MFVKTLMTFIMNRFGPLMLHVTRVPDPSGSSLKVFTLRAANGLCQSASMVTDFRRIRFGNRHASFAGTSRTAPVGSGTDPTLCAAKATLHVGSSRSCGAQRGQLCRSLMRRNIFSGLALIETERWMWKVSVLAAATIRTTAARRQTTIAIFRIILLAPVTHARTTVYFCTSTTFPLSTAAEPMRSGSLKVLVSPTLGYFDLR